MTPELLTVEEVRVLLHKCSVKAVYSMIDRGQLPGVVRLGRSVYVRAAAGRGGGPRPTERMSTTTKADGG